MSDWKIPRKRQYRRIIASRIPRKRQHRRIIASRIPRKRQHRRIIAYGLLAVAIGAGVAPAIEEASAGVSIEEIQSQSSEKPGPGGPNSGGKEDTTTEPWWAKEEEEKREAEHAEFLDLVEQAYESEKEIEESEEERKKGPVVSVETEQ